MAGRRAKEAAAMKRAYDVTVIGGGPAGLAAALKADEEGADVLLIEREARLGGILKQCIHDGFGLLRFGERLTGPEYVERFTEEFKCRQIACELQTFVTSIDKEADRFLITAVNAHGVSEYTTKSLVLATGCRERTARQAAIHGTRPSGIFTAGTAQHLVNLSGLMPAKKCVILGSGDIGLIMARRLTLEGAKVAGVYEVKPEPSGLTRNIAQCLEDYDIPLYLSRTVTRVFGDDRVQAVEVMQVDGGMRPVPGTEELIECDTLILSVGLIPENEIAESLGVPICPGTRGPVCDSHFMTGVPGIFSCGNALHVNDLVDHVSESGELAGAAAAHYRQGAAGGTFVELIPDRTIQYIVPQKLDIQTEGAAVLYFRSRETVKDGTFVIEADGKEIFTKHYRNLRPPEMERLAADLSKLGIGRESKVTVHIRQEGAVR
ncbi:NAD(P)/FAD-dependent oxidoreductase [[Clostridium] hylemonae]|uniref:NAD(P)/FAD-dependent oxidoreductase n=2 Tax=[Clostridium] hylemonae TaxID=89153 RepID=UPI003990F5F3